jgi:hypothetical protein
MRAAIGGTALLQVAIISLPFLQTVLKTSYLEWEAMSAVFIATAAAILCIELVKYFTRRKR